MNTTSDTYETRCICDDRDMLLQVLAREQQCRPVYGFAPYFTVTVGNFQLLRDGRLRYIKTADPKAGHAAASPSAEDPAPIFKTLAYLGLCEDLGSAPAPAPGGAGAPSGPADPALSCRLAQDEGPVLLHLFCILSARQRLLNQALAAQGRSAFQVAPVLMDRLLAHPPRTIPRALQMLYGHEDEYAGLRIDREQARLWTLQLTGFEKCPAEDAPIHRQLADRIFTVARSQAWVKPYTRNVRNRKYAFHTWLYAIGMGGEEYEAARTTMLDRLYGRAGSKRIDR